MQPTRGADFLTAFVAGTETECHIAMRISKRMRQLGFHSTAVVGTFGAAAAVGWLLRLDRAQMIRALGIAGCHAAGMSVASGTMVKPVQVGGAAANGALAAVLAQRNCHSPDGILERHLGFLTLHGLDDSEPWPSQIDSYFTSETLFKDYPCCFALHGAIDAALQLREDSAYDPALVTHIEASVHPSFPTHFSSRDPATPEQAKFSLPYALGIVLAGGDPTGIHGWVPNTTCTPQVISLMQCVRESVVPPKPGRSTTLRCIQSNKVERSVDSRLREPQRNLTAQWSTLALKFKRLTEPVLGDTQAAKLLTTVDKIARLDDVSEILALTTTTS
jgi:2-methylcitrate dehydratase PrpD